MSTICARTSVSTLDTSVGGKERRDFMDNSNIDFILALVVIVITMIPFIHNTLHK